MKRIYEHLGEIEKNIAKLCLIMMTILVFLSGFSRTINRPIAWAVDLATFFFAWCVFIGGDIALREDRLLNIDMFIRRLSPRVRRYIEIFNYVIIFIFLLILIIFGFYLSYTTRFRKFQGMPNFSYTWVTLSVPIGSLLMANTTIVKIKEMLSKKID